MLIKLSPNEVGRNVQQSGREKEGKKKRMGHSILPYLL
jgi:hypothetical protein